MGKDFIPWKNWKLPQYTNMFFQPMSDFYTLIIGLLAHSWFEIMEYSQISVKRGNIFELSVLNQTWLFVERKSGVFLRFLIDHQISEELINLRLKCSFLSLVQVTPFYGIIYFVFQLSSTSPKIFWHYLLYFCTTPSYLSMAA